MNRYLAIPLCACLLYPASLAAGEIPAMPSVHYDNIAAKMIMNGYRDLRVVDASAGIMSAYDSDGSEVVVRVDEVSRRILSTVHVHDADKW